MNNYISLKVILDNILDHPLLRDVSFERAVNYTLLFLLIVNIPASFIEKTEYIEIKEYRGVLPCDFYKMILVRQKLNNDYNVFRYSTDSFHYSNDKTNHPELTYKLLGQCIFTSVKDTIIEIAYQAIAVDDEGYPLVPDNAAFINALELYIKNKHFTILFDLGKISQLALLNSQLEYCWAVGLALSSMIMPSIDEMLSITNSLNTMLQRVTVHRRGFIDNGSLEFLKVK